MAITSRNDGYKISQLDEIEGLKTDMEDPDGATLAADTLFIVSNTDDGGSSYSSKKLKYSDLVTSLATSMDQMLGGSGGGTIIGGGGGCYFEGIGVPGSNYPIANAFFKDQRLSLTSIDFNCPENKTGIYYGEQSILTVPDIENGKLVNVYVILSGYSNNGGDYGGTPGVGIFIKQKNTSDGSEINVPIRDKQVDTRGWCTCIANFIAQPGTRFGAFIYNPMNDKQNHLSAFYQVPVPASFEGEEQGEAQELRFKSTDLTASEVNGTLSGSAGYYEVRSSLAVAEIANMNIQASIDNGASWNNIFLTKLPTNAGCGSAATKLRKHQSIYIPAGCILRAVTTKNVALNKYVTNKDPAVIYLTKKDGETITDKHTYGIAAVFNVTDSTKTTETFALQLKKSGKLNIKWINESSANQTIAKFGEQLNYVSKDKHDGQWGTTSASYRVLHQYSSNGSHLAYIGGVGGEQSIQAFKVTAVRNCITDLSTYSPTVLSASCLSGISSLKSLYSNTGKISSLQNYCVKDCSSLTSVQLTCASNLTINGQCFAGDTSLQKIKITGGPITKDFGNSFAKNCYSLSSVDLPDFNAKVGDQIASEAPFYGCSSLTSLTLDANYTGYIGGAIAGQCTSLKEFTWNGGCKIVNGHTVFDEATRNSLTSLSISFEVAPYTMTGAIISASSSLKTVNLNNVKISTAQAFRNNTELTSVVFDGICSPIPSKAFSACPKLKDVVFKENTAQYITKTLFGTKCFQISPMTDINMYFPDSISTDTIKDIMKYNTGANSILYVDVNKNDTITRSIRVYRLKAKGHTDDSTKESKLRIGTFTFTHTKNKSGTSTYDLNWDHNDTYQEAYNP